MNLTPMTKWISSITTPSRRDKHPRDIVIMSDHSNQQRNFHPICRNQPLKADTWAMRWRLPQGNNTSSPLPSSINKNVQTRVLTLYWSNVPVTILTKDLWKVMSASTPGQAGVALNCCWLLLTCNNVGFAFIYSLLLVLTQLQNKYSDSPKP